MSDRTVRFHLLFRILCPALVAARGENNPLLAQPPPSGRSPILVTRHTTGDQSGSRAAARHR